MKEPQRGTGGSVVPDAFSPYALNAPTTSNPYTLVWFMRPQSWAARMAAAPTWRTQLQDIWPNRVHTYLVHIGRAVLGRECPCDGDDW